MLPLQRVDSIKYLGIQTNRDPADYVSFNKVSLYKMLKQKIQIWTRLPLGLMGQINLVEMVLLPKILYGLALTSVLGAWAFQINGSHTKTNLYGATIGTSSRGINQKTLLILLELPYPTLTCTI